jgi:hypothetical protein
MTGFRAYLAAMALTIFLYTAVVIANHGWGLLPVFFGDMGQMGWPGQFNLDFMFMLTLSALWVAWRHQYSAGGLALAFFAAVGGSAFLSVYLLVVSFQAKGDVRALLLGARALP